MAKAANWGRLRSPILNDTFSQDKIQNHRIFHSKKKGRLTITGKLIGALIRCNTLGPPASALFLHSFHLFIENVGKHSICK